MGLRAAEEEKEEEDEDRPSDTDTQEEEEEVLMVFPPLSAWPPLLLLS